jgi:hypothetical protein
MSPTGTLQTAVDREAGLTEFTVTGAVAPEVLLQAIRDFYAGEPTHLVLWDLREADLSALRSDDVRLVVEATEPAGETRPGGLTAMVFSQDAGYGLGRMFEILQGLRDPSVRRRSFRDLAEARRWLGLE